MLFVEVDSLLSITMFNMFPKKFRVFIQKRIKPEIFIVILIILAILPVAIDGFYQLLTPYESTNFKRVLTGISMGWIGGVLLGAMILTVSWVAKPSQNVTVGSD
jgi:uncharacterized membrane protein